jgi:transcriptional regulator with XRE-family HTH domain
VPRPNRGRDTASEDNLARRIAYERERRGWSYAGLAERMTKAGCVIAGSALYKVEKNTPRRTISVAELCALSEVFAVPVEELLMPPELHAKLQALTALKHYRQARAAYYAALDELAAVSDADPLVNDVLTELLPLDDIPTAELQYALSKMKRAAAEGKHGEVAEIYYGQVVPAERKPDEEGATGGQHREEA